jgi:hypothetical protein
MQQKDMRVGMEVAVGSHIATAQKAVVKKLGVELQSWRRNGSGISVEFVKPCKDHMVGETRTVTGREVLGSWERAKDAIEQYRTQMRKREAADLEAQKRVERLADQVKRATGVEPFATVDRRTRELGRDRANKPIRQPIGDRLQIDTAAIEALVQLLEDRDG